MPPKKQQPKVSPAPAKDTKKQEADTEQEEGETQTIDNKQKKNPSTTSTTKRKRASKSASNPLSNKTPRRSARSTNPAHPTPSRTLHYLLSTSCFALSSPTHETEALTADPTLRTYTSTIPLSPFEELLAAVILSRPISHSLGQRALRYLINAPRNLTTPAAIQRLPEGQVHTWLDEARTQHKAKTAEQVRGLADKVVEMGWAVDAEDKELRGLRGTIDGEDPRGSLQGMLVQIKGLGRTGTEIFMRRMQGFWRELGPFVDQRTEGSLRKLGLPSEGEELLRLIEEDWEGLEVGDVGGEDEEARKMLVIVKVLERAVGADLEGNVDEVLQNAAKA